MKLICVQLALQYALFDLSHPANPHLTIQIPMESNKWRWHSQSPWPYKHSISDHNQQDMMEWEMSDGTSQEETW